MVKELGYIFYPGRRPSEPGYSRLDILITAKPSGLHFDPKFVTLTVYSLHRGLELLKIHYGWRHGDQFRVAAGQIHIEDKTGKEIEAFTFGGDLSIDSNDPQVTRCTLVSEAPILGNYAEDSAACVISEETQILLAERHAAWEGREDEFEMRMGSAEPLALYYACLAALQDRLKHIHMGDDAGKYQVIGRINEEMHYFTRAAGQRTGEAAILRIEDLL